MGFSNVLGGMIAGIGKRAKEQNEQLLQQEVDRREGLVALYKELYESPNIPPEMKQKFLQYMFEIPQIPYDKKLPKQYTDVMGLLDERQQLQGPMGPPSAAIGAAPTPPTAPPGQPRPTPEGLIGSAMGEAQQAGVPYAPPGGGFPAPAPGAGALPPGAGAPPPGAGGITPPGPAPSLDYTPEQLQTIRDFEARGAAATAINVANQYKKANLRPPGIDPNMPVELSPGEMAVPTGPSGEMLPEGAFTAPAGAPTGEGPGSFDHYARAALIANGFDPNDAADRPGQRNLIIAAAKRQFERPPIGVFMPLIDGFGTILGFYNAQTGESTGPPPETALAPGARVLPGEAPGPPGTFPPQPPGPPGVQEYSQRELEGIRAEIGRGLESGVGTAGPAARRTGISLSERDKMAAMKVMLQDVDRLRYYAGQHPEAIGLFWGNIYKFGRGITDVPVGINKMFRIGENLAELLLRARSGAQINESEFKRLRDLMPNPANPPTKFWADLSEYFLETKRLYEMKFNKRYTALEILPDGSIWEVDERGNRSYLEGGEEGAPPGAQ